MKLLQSLRRFFPHRLRLANNEETLALENASIAGAFAVKQGESLFLPYGDVAYHKKDPTTRREIKLTQRFDAEAGRAMANAFHGIVGQAHREINEAHVPIYEGHPDVPGMQQTYTDRGAKGWVERITPEPTGLRVHVKWNDTGAHLVETAAFKFYSPFWETTAPRNGQVRPVRLISIGLTNQPNMKGLPALANDQQSSVIETMKLKPEILKLLGLAEDADVEATALENAIGVLHTRCTTAETERTERDEALTLANNNLGAETTKATQLANDLNAARTDRDAARAIIVDTGIARLTQSGHLVPADVPGERSRLIALANTADITTALVDLGKGTPKIKMQSVTTNAAGAGAQLALANDAQARATKFRELVSTKQTSLENTGTPKITAYNIAFAQVSREHPELIQSN